MPVARRGAYYHIAAALMVLGHLAPANAARMQDVETHRFENGLTLHVAAGHQSPVAAIQAWVGVGSADETPQLAGAAHVVEHMLFKGSMRYGRGELVESIAKGGGEINAWTSLDQTVYHAVLANDHVDAAVDAMGDALLAPSVEPAELAREREVILEEIRQGADDPARSVVQQLFATAYQQHPYRRPVIGTVDSVKRLRDRDVVEFFRSHYVADNLTLVVAGDVDPGRVRRTVERRFRAMPSGRPARNHAIEPAQTSTRTAAAQRALEEAYVSVGFHVPSARHPDLAALDVAALLLGQNESARLDRALRVEQALVTSAYANVHALRDPGMFVLSATTKSRDAKRTAGALVEHALGLANAISDDELMKARVAAETSFVRELETVQGRARALGWYATIAGDPNFGHVYLDRVRAVRRHDLATVLRRYLTADNASVAAILPGKSTATTFTRAASLQVKRAVATAPAPATNAERRVTLPNGATLIVRRDPSVPVVAMRAVWQGGQRVEDAATAGASTLIARLATRGCGALDAASVADRIDRLGGSVAAIAGRNSFGVAAEWLARSWGNGFDLFADCITQPTFEELERERRAILDDQLVQRDSPSQQVFALFTKTLYGAHPYARDALGTAASIGALTKAQLVAFHRRHHAPGKMVLAIVGDVDVDDVIARATKRFATPDPATAPVAAPQPLAFGAREVYQYLDREQGHLVVGFPGTTITSADRFALEVLVAILSGQSGRLFTELREKRGLVYRVSAHSVEGIDPGFVAIYLSCAPDKLDAAHAAVTGVLTSLRTHGITPDELARAQSNLVGNHQIAMQRRSAIANAIAYHEAYGLGWQSWAGYATAIKSVRQADVAAAIATYLRDDRAIVATVRPKAATPAATKRSRIGKRS